MKIQKVTGLLIVLCFGFASCDLAMQETQKNIRETASAIDQELAKVRKGQEALISRIDDLYARLDTLDLSTKGMDLAEGGIYQTFPGGKYYYKSKPEGSALYASPGRAVDEALRRQVKFLEYVDPYLQEAGKSSDVQVIAFYGVRLPTTIALMSPWFDVVSRLPPGITLDMFEWYQRGVASPGPAVWSEQPFTDLSSGWVMDVAIPARLKGVVQGVGVSSVSMDKLSAKYIRGQKGSIVLMGADTTVVGISPSAQDILKITALENFDFLKQMKENTFAPGKFRLTDKSQPEALVALGQGLSSGLEPVTFRLGEKTYVALQQLVPETGMKVVGIILK